MQTSSESQHISWIGKEQFVKFCTGEIPALCLSHAHTSRWTEEGIGMGGSFFICKNLYVLRGTSSF